MRQGLRQVEQGTHVFDTRHAPAVQHAPVTPLPCIKLPPRSYMASAAFRACPMPSPTPPHPPPHHTLHPTLPDGILRPGGASAALRISPRKCMGLPWAQQVVGLCVWQAVDT